MWLCVVGLLTSGEEEIPKRSRVSSRKLGVLAAFSGTSSLAGTNLSGMRKVSVIWGPLNLVEGICHFIFLF